MILSFYFKQLNSMFYNNLLVVSFLTQNICNKRKLSDSDNDIKNLKVNK